ncbi:MAG: PAS domain S-box protein, partial [Candidatus Nitrosotenuis sp.]
MGITKPILKLRDAADLIGKGNFDHKIIARSNDEIGDLARQFESMRKNIQEKNTNLNEIVKERTKDFTNIMNTLNATAIVAITDKDGIIKHVNQKFVEISGYAKEELIGQNHRILKSGYHKSEFFDNMWKIISGGKTFEGEIKNKAKDGKFYWVKTTIVPFLDESGNPEEYIAIHDDITKLKNIEEELQDALRRNEKDASIIQHQMEDLKIANLELQQKDKLKHEFLSMASHELKTPLTPILGWCDALKSPQILGNLSPNQLSAIETIEKNAEKLEKLIGDMLDVQKLELDEIKFNISDSSIAKILDTIKKDFEFAVKEKNITFEISSDTDTTIKSDERRIIQVLSALIYNSIDFVPEKSGKINVMVNKNNNEILFCVQDNGMGIPKEKQQYLFKKFYQVDTSLTRKHGGTGLGLVISKGLVEGLGGKIW